MGHNDNFRYLKNVRCDMRRAVFSSRDVRLALRQGTVCNQPEVSMLTSSNGVTDYVTLSILMTLLLTFGRF